MTITYFGHSSFLFEIGGKRLLFDPFITGNELATHININEIKADYILISHGHIDHVADVEKIANNNNALIISNWEIVSWYEKKGLKGHPMNFGGKWSFDFGTVKSVVAAHSSQMPDGSGGGNPGGFIIESKEGVFYFAGDTALTLDMKLIPMTSPKLDFAILPIGDNFTMGIEDAILASDFINCNTIVGCHYDTFGYIKIDHSLAKKSFADKGKKLVLLDIGKDQKIVNLGL